jgi:hypothetical protein
VDRGGQRHGLRQLVRRGIRAGFLADPVGDLSVSDPRPSHERRDGRELEREFGRGGVVSHNDAGAGQARDLLVVCCRQHCSMVFRVFHGTGNQRADARRD